MEMCLCVSTDTGETKDIISNKGSEKSRRMDM